MDISHARSLIQSFALQYMTPPFLSHCEMDIPTINPLGHSTFRDAGKNHEIGKKGKPPIPRHFSAPMPKCPNGVTSHLVNWWFTH